MWWIFAAALAIRLALVPLPGYDVGAFRAWSDAMAREGLTRAYELELDPAINYPPVPLYVFFGLGTIHRAFVTPAADAVVPASWIKLTVIAFELMTILTLAVLIRRAEAPDSHGALIWTAAYAFHPAIIWNTAYWAASTR